jgi:hypothetical protein
VVAGGKDDHKTETTFNDTDSHGICLTQAVKSFEFQEEDRGSIPGQSVWDFVDDVASGLVLLLEPDFPRKLHNYRGADKSFARPTSQCTLFDG